MKNVTFTINPNSYSTVPLAPPPQPAFNVVPSPPLPPKLTHFAFSAQFDTELEAITFSQKFIDFLIKNKDHQ